MNTHQKSPTGTIPREVSEAISRALRYLEGEAEIIGMKRLGALIRIAAIEADDLSMEPDCRGAGNNEKK